jgi:hypothetical protein
MERTEMLSYIILEKLADEYQRERRAEADAERLGRASKAQGQNKDGRLVASSLRDLLPAASRLLARALRAWPWRGSLARGQS